MRNKRWLMVELKLSFKLGSGQWITHSLFTSTVELCDWHAVAARWFDGSLDKGFLKSPRYCRWVLITVAKCLLAFSLQNWQVWAIRPPDAIKSQIAAWQETKNSIHGEGWMFLLCFTSMIQHCKCFYRHWTAVKRTSHCFPDYRGEKGEKSVNSNRSSASRRNRLHCLCLAEMLHWRSWRQNHVLKQESVQEDGLCDAVSQVYIRENGKLWSFKQQLVSLA